MGREDFRINFYWKLPVWSIQALQRALCSLLRLCRAAVELWHLCKEPEVRDGHVLVIESLTAAPPALNCEQVE